MTFNHGVEGSSPSALTNETGRFSNFLHFSQSPRVCTVSANALPRRVRRALAFPVSAAALLLILLGGLLDQLAAKIAGDEWE